MYSESKRVEFLDSIRGLAALFVLLCHTVSAFSWPPVYSQICNLPFVSIIFDGKGAVCMFFVLSGYVLSKPYVPSPENTSPRKIFLPTFYLRRITRIWLPWFFAFIASIVARKFFFDSPSTSPATSEWFNQFWRSPITVGEYLRQCVFMLHDSSRQLLNQDWSLGVELKGSFLVPLFLVLSRRKWLFLIFALAAGFLLGLHTGHYYVSFIIGVMLAQHGARIVDSLSRWEPKLKLLFLVMGLLLYQVQIAVVLFFGGFWPLYKCGWTVTSLGCACILLAVLSSNRLQTFLEGKLLVFLGRISYSVYLLQFVIILCLLPKLMHLANQCGLFNQPVLFVLALVVSVGATLGVAAIAYSLVEVPSIQIGHWLTKKIQLKWQPPALSR